MSDSSTSDRALDLADKWAQQIGEKLNAAAPGAADVALQAAVVQAGSVIITFIGCLIALVLALMTFRFCIDKMNEAKTTDEGMPFFIGTMGSGFAIVFFLIASCATFPAKELMGLYAPKGYVALLVLDKINK